MSARIVPGLLIALLIALHAQIWFGRGSVGDVIGMGRKLESQQAANRLARQANERMANEIRDLREGLEMVEEKARTELGMVKPNEVYVQVTLPSGKAAPGAPAPRATN